MNIQNNLEFSSKNRQFNTDAKTWFSKEIANMQSPIFVSLTSNDYLTHKLPKCLSKRQEIIEGYVYSFDFKINRKILGKNFHKDQFKDKRLIGYG